MLVPSNYLQHTFFKIENLSQMLIVRKVIVDIFEKLQIRDIVVSLVIAMFELK